MSKKSLVRLLCILLIIILSLSIIVLINKNKRNNKTDNQEQANQEVIIPIDEDVIIPGDSYIFFGKYIHGKVSSKTIYNTINYCTKTIIPKYYSDLKDASDNDISNYFENNKTEIWKLFNIDNKQDFLSLIKELKQLNLENLELAAVDFVEDDIKVNNDSTDAKLIITYNKDRKIEIYMKVYRELQKFNRNIVFYNK
ncbi:MAG: hypothetical protein IKN65_02140 [Clostridia bacterium]|nr:hypothetical protein [Clostridia bacterium]